MRDELTTEEAKRAIDEFEDAGVAAIAFSGGFEVPHLLSPKPSSSLKSLSLLKAHIPSLKQNLILESKEVETRF